MEPVDKFAVVAVLIGAGDVEKCLRDRQRGAQFVGGIGCESLLFGDVRFESREHGIEAVGEFAELPDKRRAMDEMRRVLHPGGRLALADVVLDRSRLPAELDGAFAVIACVGEALSSRGYEALLADAGFRLIATEPRYEDAAALAERVHDRLRGARLLGLDLGPRSPLSVDQAIELVHAARGAIADRALGYAILAASL